MPLQHGVDGVARGPRHVADDHRSSLSNRLTSDDLPTFGRPTMATRVFDVLRRRGSSRVPSGQRRDDLVEQIPDAVAVFGGNLDDRLEAEL